MKQYIIDRIEDGFAVLETEEKEHLCFPVKNFPDAIREGDVLIWEENGFRIDTGLTEQRRERIAERLERLFSKND